MMVIYLCAYVDDIIFGCTNQRYNKEFCKMMAKEYAMFMIGELNIFLGLQVWQQKNANFISREKYLKDCMKKFGMENAKGINTSMLTNGNLNSSEKGKLFDEKVYHSLIGYLLYLCYAVFACLHDFKPR